MQAIWRTWVLGLVALGLLTLSACASANQSEPELLPEPSGPALIFFYTDG